MNINWVPSMRMDFRLDQLNVTFDVAELELAALDFEGTARINKGRTEGTDPKRIDDIAKAQRDGMPFEMPVWFEKGSDEDPGNPLRYLIADGRHRTGSAKQNNVKKIKVYLIKGADAYTREVIMRTANRFEGCAIDRATAAAHALHMQEQYKTEITELAEIFNIPVNHLKEEMRILKEKRLIASHGYSVYGMDDYATEPVNGSKKAVKSSTPISKSALRLFIPVQNLKVKMACIKACSRYAMDTATSENLAVAVRSLKHESEGAQLAKVEEFCASLVPAEKAEKRKRKRNSFVAALRTLHATIKGRNSIDMLVTAYNERRAIKPTLMEIGATLVSYAKQVKE